MLLSCVPHPLAYKPRRPVVRGPPGREGLKPPELPPEGARARREITCFLLPRWHPGCRLRGNLSLRWPPAWAALRRRSGPSPPGLHREDSRRLQPESRLVRNRCDGWLDGQPLRRREGHRVGPNLHPNLPDRQVRKVVSNRKTGG